MKIIFSTTSFGYVPLYICNMKLRKGNKLIIKTETRSGIDVSKSRLYRDLSTASIPLISLNKQRILNKLINN